MEALRSFGRKLLGLNRDNKVEIVKEVPSSRKRQLEEEEVTKDSLNQPAKRRRMSSTEDQRERSSQPADTSVTSPVQAIFSKVKSWFSVKSRPEMVECPPAVTPVADTIQAAPPTLYSSRLDTDEVELLKVVNPKLEQVETSKLEQVENSEQSLPSSDESPMSQPADTLATFTGFKSSETRKDSSTTSGHSIRTGYDRERKADLLSPQNIRKRLQAGFRSTYDKFYHEKDIVKRVSMGSIKKPKQNAFEYSAALADKSRYKALLERHTGNSMFKYNAWTNRSSILFDTKSSSPSRGKGAVPLSGAACVDDVDTAKMVTSTVMKPRLTSTTIKTDKTSDIKPEVEASPVLIRDRVEKSLPPSVSSTTKHRSSHSLMSPPTPQDRNRAFANISDLPWPANSLEQKLACEEVYSPEFIPKLWNKYGAVAREREKQIQREEDKKRKCEQETEELFKSIDKRLESHLKITQVALPEEDIEEGGDDPEQPTELPDLTQEMKEVIRRAERSRGEVLVDAHKIQITVKDINTLKGLQWLNDEVINFYMQMIVTRSGQGKLPKVYACTTFFYPKLKDGGHASVKRWTKKVDIFEHAIVLVPVHLGMHWCLATIDMQRKAIMYYDSMGGRNKGCLEALAKYVEDEHLAKKGAPLDMTSWKKECAKDIPQQMNGSDCGMFTCKFAEYISRRARFTFSQKNMPYFRQRMIYEIVKNQLLHP